MRALAVILVVGLTGRFWIDIEDFLLVCPHTSSLLIMLRKPFINQEVEISTFFSTATILWDKFLTPAYFFPQQMSHHFLIYNWSWFWEKWLWFLTAALWSLKRHRSWPVLVTSGLIMSESGCLVVWHQSWIRTLRWIRRKGAWQDIACDEAEYPGTHPDLSKQICKHISHSQI